MVCGKGSKPVKERVDNTRSLSLAISCCTLLLAGTALYRGITQYHHRPVEKQDTLAFGKSGFKANSPFGHPYFRYSVIPGGVHSAEDLRRALSNDDIIRAHYADFQSENARVIVLDKDRLAFVSYRIGEKVFWTHKPVHLRKGEELLTDGKHLARTRCGNRISEDLRGPKAAFEPEEPEFTAPVLISTGAPLFQAADLDVGPDLPLDLAPTSDTPKPVTLLASDILPASFALRDYLPVETESLAKNMFQDRHQAVIISAPYIGLDQISSPPSPVSSLPEPASLSLTLLAAGSAVLVWRRKLKRSLSESDSVTQ